VPLLKKRPPEPDTGFSLDSAERRRIREQARKAAEQDEQRYTAIREEDRRRKEEEQRRLAAAATEKDAQRRVALDRQQAHTQRVIAAKFFVEHTLVGALSQANAHLQLAVENADLEAAITAALRCAAIERAQTPAATYAKNPIPRCNH
jgi:hypothetical protein